MEMHVGTIATAGGIFKHQKKTIFIAEQKQTKKSIWKFIKQVRLLINVALSLHFRPNVSDRNGRANGRLDGEQTQCLSDSELAEFLFALWALFGDAPNASRDVFTLSSLTSLFSEPFKRSN